MLKKGDDDNDEVDELTISVPSQNRVTSTLRTEAFFIRTQYFYSSPLLSERSVRGNRKYTVNAIIDIPSWDLSS
jgi:hypothetical protein